MKHKYLTVTALTQYIKRKMDMDPHLKDIWLKGEISNFKHHSRGHMYFTIKDDQTRIQAVMFAGKNRQLKFVPENGMNVLIRGEISVFEAYGQYQLYIQQMEPDGIGSLYLAFEQLKEKLRSEGLFNNVHKKSLPLFPAHIGIITSPTGAAVRDILTTIRRRYPIADTTILPVLVQGQNAAMSIKNAIEYANGKGGFDVLIVGRGGGSIEELWSFNEEVVARAIFHSTIPIISAVGHETDVTISDYAADLRAPTPTGAAELAVPSQIELAEKLHVMTRTLTKRINEKMANSLNQLVRMKQSYAFRYPEQLRKQKELILDKHVERLDKTISSFIHNKKEALVNMNKRFSSQHPERQLIQSGKKLDQFAKQNDYYTKQIFRQKSMQLTQLLDKLLLLSPLEIMKRGYAISYTTSGNVIRSVAQVNKQDSVTIKVVDGSLSCQVTDIEVEKFE